MPCFNRALCSVTSLSNQYSDHVRMKSNRMHDITELLRLVLVLPDTDYNPPALASDRLTVMHSKPRSLCERTCLFFFLPINQISFFQGIFAQSGKRKNIETRPGFWQKSLAFAHVATTRLNISSVLKLAHFTRSGRHSTATHATRARSLFAITLQAEQISQYCDSKHRNARDPLR